MRDGIEQTVRDIRVSMIYEGTNEIQAIDLLVRKILVDGGVRLQRFLAQADHTAQTDCPGSLAQEARALLELTGNIRRLVPMLQQAAVGRPQLPLQFAGEMLRLVGHVALAWLWMHAARTAEQLEPDDPLFYGSKRDTARYYFHYVFPEVQQLLAVIEGGLRGHAGTGPERAFARELAPELAGEG